MSIAPAVGASTVPLLQAGLLGPQVEVFRKRVRTWVGEQIAPLVLDAEHTRTFPRSAIERLGDSGLAHERWEQGGDLGKSLILGEELGRAATGGVGIGISVHLESVLAILLAHASTDALHERAIAALNGRQIGCLAFSEEDGGSDLTAPRTTIAREKNAWRVAGEKAFVSAGATADFALVLCSQAGHPSSYGMPALTLACVPSSGFEVVEQLDTLGVRSLQTVRLRLDATISDADIVGRPGRGLMIAAYGLTHERFAAAAQLIGGLSLAIDLTATRLHRRRQFGTPLFGHQALRLRLAALDAEVSLARGGLHALAVTAGFKRPSAARAIAGAKVSIARLAERTIAECMHMFGGIGYLESHTPLPRMWRDGLLARLGGGSDEILLELLASGLHGDEEAYDHHLASQ